MDMPELQAVMAYARRNWNQVALRATSIVAWFRMLAFRETPPVQSLFVSPVLDMAELIETMMGWAGVTAAELEAPDRLSWRRVSTGSTRRSSWRCWNSGQQNICKETSMLAYTYVEQGRFELREKPKPRLLDDRDAIVRVTLSSICTSDLHIKHGSVPRAVPGITVGHEMVGVVEEIGASVTSVRPGDRVTVNVETFCGECFFCRNGWVNNCTDPNGGWSLGCRIDGGQAEYVRVPYADQGLNKIPEGVTDHQALLVGDVLATGYWAAKISEIKPRDTVLIIGAGPTGLCTLQCVLLKEPRRVIVCDKDPHRLKFVRDHYPQVLTVGPEQVKDLAQAYSDHGGADVVLEVAGSEETFRMAWECARPNATVTVVALYDGPQTLPLPEMYGKNLTFKTGGVDGCDCDETLRLIAEGKLDTTDLITHTYPLRDIAAAYELFESRQEGVIKVAIQPGGDA